MEDTKIETKMQDTIINRLGKVEGACLFKLDEQDNLIPIKKSCFISVGKRDEKGSVGIRAYGDSECYEKINAVLTEKPFPLDE